MGRPVRLLLHPDEMMRSELRQGYSRWRPGGGIFRLSSTDEAWIWGLKTFQISELGTWWCLHLTWEVTGGKAGIRGQVATAVGCREVPVGQPAEDAFSQGLRSRWQAPMCPEAVRFAVLPQTSPHCHSELETPDAKKEARQQHGWPSASEPLF